MAVAEINVRVCNAKEIAERIARVAVLCAKIGAHCEDIAREMRELARFEDKDATITQNAPATPESIGESPTETVA